MALCLGVGGLIFLVTRRASTQIRVGHREGAFGRRARLAYGWARWRLTVLSLPGFCGREPLLRRHAAGRFRLLCLHKRSVRIHIGFYNNGASIITDGLWGEPGLTPMVVQVCLVAFFSGER